jgi:hypothetical protein
LRTPEPTVTFAMVLASGKLIKKKKESQADPATVL